MGMLIEAVWRVFQCEGEILKREDKKNRHTYPRKRKRRKRRDNENEQNKLTHHESHKHDR